MQTYLGREEIGADSYLGPTRYKVTCRCLRCGKNYSRIFKAVPVEDPPCPRKKCREAALREQIERERDNMDRIISEQRTPGMNGADGVRIIDRVAQITMQDHKLTDLKDNLRPGDIMAPRLPYHQQKAADNFFQGPPKGSNVAQQRRFKQLGAMALRGAFAGNAINPAAVLPGKRGEAVLRKIGTEKLRG